MSEKYHQAFSKNAWFKKKTFFFNFEAFNKSFILFIFKSMMKHKSICINTSQLTKSIIGCNVQLNLCQIWKVKHNKQTLLIFDFKLIVYLLNKNEKKILVKGVLIYILTFLRLNCNNNLYINETCEFQHFNRQGKTWY